MEELPAAAYIWIIQETISIAQQVVEASPPVIVKAISGLILPAVHWILKI